MIKQYKGFKAEKTSGPREILPAGGYVAKIVSAKVESYTWGDRLAVAYDVAEGEYAGFFKRDYDNNPNEDKKWRGVFRLTIPTDSEDQQNKWSRRRFNNFTACLEESNPNYHWDWNEEKLRGLMVGILVRDREWEMNGNTGWTTEACDAACIEAIRAGKFRTPKAFPLKNKPVVEADYAAAQTAAPVEDDSDLPF